MCIRDSHRGYGVYEGGGLFPLLEHFCIGKDLVQLAHKGDDIAVIQRTMIHSAVSYTHLGTGRELQAL